MGQSANLPVGQLANYPFGQLANFQLPVGQIGQLANFPIAPVANWPVARTIDVLVADAIEKVFPSEWDKSGDLPPAALFFKWR